MALLEVQGLRVELVPGHTGRAVPVVDAADLTISKGQTVAVVGESGCGKSVTAMAIGGLLSPRVFRRHAQKLRFDGIDLLHLSEPDMRRIRGKRIGFVFQHAGATLNPVMRIRAQIMEVLRLHRPERTSSDHVRALLEQVGLPDPIRLMDAYPFMLSGGMQQRVAIAIAIAAEPDLLIADEPTSALDVTIQAQVLDLLRSIKARNGMAILLVTHNFGVVTELADTVAVMYAGEVVESGPAAAVISNPKHPYTEALIKCVPRLTGPKAPLPTIPGSVPAPGCWPKGCRFAPRCSLVKPMCVDQHPPLEPVGENHRARCWLRTGS